MNRFVLTSTLKAKAQREAKKNIAEWSKSQRMVNQFTGASTLKKNHFRDAERKFKASSGISDLRKAEYLISALYDIYISYFMMKNNRFTDTKVSELLKRIKTSYFNTVLNYIEQNIYQPGYSEKIYLELKQALQVLSEENRQLANGYKKILVQYNNRESFLVKTENILQIPPIEFTSSFSDKIAALWRRNESVLKKNNSFMKEVQDKISDKMNLIFEYFWDELQEELNKTSPHLEKAVASAEKILNIHKPLKLIVNCKYYTRLKEMTDKYADYKKFLDIKYPEFLKLYQYLQIPKNKEPLKQIYDAFTELEETKELWANNFYEFSRLDPGPGIIFKFLDDKLYNTHKSEIISYYKHYNKILSEPDIALKLKEMIRYSEHLQNKMIKVLQNPFLASKLKELIGSITEDVRKTVYTYLEDKLKYSNSYEEKIGFYDEAVASFIALKSLDDVENVQKQKQKFIHNELSFAPENINEDFEDETETIKIENIPTKLIILDNYTLKNYIIFSGYQIEMGRSEDNDIILQCPWISQKHAN
ncbi:MAG: hypothetical protein CSB55_00990 [Candidatus Cloacimonadota bacterium]|nr:MAG: hypothetical protein CSB55_00990 [Candidatus Cloacimonadota bacterium]